MTPAWWLDTRAVVVNPKQMQALVSALVASTQPPSVTFNDAAVSAPHWAALVGWAELYARHPALDGYILTATQQAHWRQVLEAELSPRGRSALVQLEAHADAVHDAQREAVFALGLAAGYAAGTQEPPQ